MGGTFVDFVLLDETTGEITLEKQPSTPERIVEEVGAGIGRLPVRLAEVGAYLSRHYGRGEHDCPGAGRAGGSADYHRDFAMSWR